MTTLGRIMMELPAVRTLEASSPPGAIMFAGGIPGKACSFAKMMGGEITVTSQLRKGSIFRFEIPIQKTKEEVSPVRAETKRRPVGLRYGQPSFRILVADDKEENRILLRHRLGAIGFETREVGRRGAQWQTGSPGNKTYGPRRA